MLKERAKNRAERLKYRDTNIPRPGRCGDRNLYGGV